MLDRELYSRVFGNTEMRASDAIFTVLATRNEIGHGRLGLAISKKSVRLASHRNRIKRLVRETFRQHPARRNPQDVVVMCRRGADSRPNRSLINALDKLFTELGAP